VPFVAGTGDDAEDGVVLFATLDRFVKSIEQDGRVFGVNQLEE